MKKTILFLTIFLFSSCSARYAERKIANLKERYNLSGWETVILRDTLYIPAKTISFQAYLDSLQCFKQSSDGWNVTGKIDTNGLVTVHVSTPPDTVYIEKPIPVETIKVEVKERNVEKTMNSLTLLFFVIFAGVIILKVITWQKKE